MLLLSDKYVFCSMAGRKLETTSARPASCLDDNETDFMSLVCAHLHGWHIQRRRQVSDHGIQQRLHALVLEGAAAEDGNKAVPDAALPNQPLQRLCAGLLALYHEAPAVSRYLQSGTGTVLNAD